jgi:hypothetical protein
MLASPLGGSGGLQLRLAGRERFDLVAERLAEAATRFELFFTRLSHK